MSKSSKQAAIDRELKKVYQVIDVDREPVCAGCDRGDRPLSHSHTIGQGRCKQIGKPELISDPSNIEFMCFGTSTSCHEIWEYEGIKQRMQLNNFDAMMLYIQQHDEERFRAVSIAIESVTEGLGNNN